jgi:hypothetical protein
MRVYFATNTGNKYLVLDGQQRLTHVFATFKGFEHCAFRLNRTQEEALHFYAGVEWESRLDRRLGGQRAAPCVSGGSRLGNAPKNRWLGEESASRYRRITLRAGLSFLDRSNARLYLRQTFGWRCLRESLDLTVRSLYSSRPPCCDVHRYQKMFCRCEETVAKAEVVIGPTGTIPHRPYPRARVEQ